jgi:uncharacterized membrane protein YphA (DoxX/SURF4 family)
MTKVKQGSELVARLFLALMMLSGGVMHFTLDAHSFNSPFIDAMAATGYLWQLIGVINIVTGVALLVNRYVPLALVLMAPISVNILAYHTRFLEQGGIVIGLLITGANLWLMWRHRASYVQLLRPQPGAVLAQ